MARGGSLKMNTDHADAKKSFAFLNDLSIQPELLPPLVLAYIGDAVFELYVRLRLIPEVHKVQTLHKHAINWVNAGSQSKLLKRIEPVLNDEERQIVKRGRNAKSKVPRNTDMIEYRYSTGFEALIGHLYLSGQAERLIELFTLIGPIE